MEEDIALANIALDQFGVARLLLTYAGELEGAGRDEDDLAYLRDDREFRNVQLVELANGDFAVTMAKLLFLRLPAAALRSAGRGADERLAGIAGKARQGVGLPPRPQRTSGRSGWATAPRSRTAGCRRPWTRSGPTPTSCSTDDADGCARPWLATVEPVLAEATLDRPADGGRRPAAGGGVHTEQLSYLLAEMQVLHRAHPGARW